MTYKEIEKIAKKYGWTTTSAATLYRIEKEYGDTTNYIVIGKFNRTVIFIKNERCNPGDLIVIKAAMKLAETPPEERQEEKKFYISSKLTPDDDGRFLFKIGDDVKHLGWGYKDGGGTKFIQDEIDFIKKKYNTDLKDFEIIEVEE